MTETVKHVTAKPHSGSPCYVSTYHMTTEDYRRCTQTSCSRDPPSTNDKDPEGCFPGPSNGIQIGETLGQENSGRFVCATGTRDNTRPGEHQGHQVLKTYFQKLSEKAISPHQATPGSWAMTSLRLLTLLFNHKNRRQCLRTLQ